MDLKDVAAFQQCFYASSSGGSAWLAKCRCVFDANLNTVVDRMDLGGLVTGLTGP